MISGSSAYGPELSFGRLYVERVLPLPAVLPEIDAELILPCKSLK